MSVARPIRVLLVEDHIELNRAIGMALETHFEVTSVRDGQEAVEHLRALPPLALPDVVLFDVNMPRMDGWQLREALLANPLWATLPVVAMSAWPGDQETERQLNGFLRKPFDLGDLVRTLERCAQLAP